MIRILFFAIFSPVVLLFGWKLTKFLRPIISRTSWFKRIAYSAAIAAGGIGLQYVLKSEFGNTDGQFAGDLLSAMGDYISILIYVDVLVVGYLCIMFCIVPYERPKEANEKALQSDIGEPPNLRRSYTPKRERKGKSV